MCSSDLGNPKDANFDYNNLPEGNVTVKVTAKSIDGTTTEATEEIVPDESEETLNENIKINIVKSETDSTKAILSADYSEGIKEVLLNVNDVDYTVTLPEENPKNTSIELPLVQGNNRITLTIIGTDDTRNVKIEEIPGE